MRTPDDLSKFSASPVFSGKQPLKTHKKGILQMVPNKPSPRNRRGGKWELRKRAVANLLRMGHFAPTVMQTLLDGKATADV